MCRATGRSSYAPAAGFDGSDTYKYTVSDGNGGTDTASVSVNVFLPSSGVSLRGRIAAAPEGSWLKVNANRFDTVWTPVAQRARVNGAPFGEPRKIITAWSSMAWDGNRRQLIIWGGGHANYAGNEVYRFDAATLRWQRASLPSAVEPRFGDRRFFAVDGAMNAPISSHTYDNQEFLPRADRFITFGGASYNAGRVFLLDDGVTRTGPYLWDPSRADANRVGGTTGSAIFRDVLGGRMWMNRNALVINGSGASRPDAFVNGTSAYVFEGGVESILVSESPQNGGDLFRYRITDLEDPTLDRWELIGPGQRTYSDQGAGAYDPIHRVYLRTAKMGTGYGIVMWNVATPGRDEPARQVHAPERRRPVRALEAARHGLRSAPQGVRALERRRSGLVSQAARLGLRLYADGLDRDRRPGCRGRRPGAHRHHRRARQVEIHREPRRDARPRSRLRRSGLDLQAPGVAGAMKHGRRSTPVS